MAKEVATTKWCPVCNHSQKIKGFRSYRCRDCWVAAGKPKVNVHFKAMDSQKPKPAEAVIKKTPKKVSKPIEYKPIVLIEDRPAKRARKKTVKKIPKKATKKVVKKVPKKTIKKVTKKATKKVAKKVTKKVKTK